MSWTKKLLTVILAGTIMFATSGCIKLNFSLTVGNDDLISGTAISAISKELAAYATESGQSTESSNTNLFQNNPKVTVSKFDDGTWVGERYSYQSMPLSEFNAFADSSSSLRISREGDNLLVTGLLDMSSGDTSGQDSALGIDPSSLFDVRFTISLPGKILSSTGSVSGNTITWKGQYGTPLELRAVALAPKSKAGVSGSIKPNGPSNLAISNILADSVSATYDFPSTFSQIDLKSKPHFVGYFSTKSGKLLGQQYISSLSGPLTISGLGIISERNLTFKIMSKSKATSGNVKVSLPKAPSTVTKLAYKKNSLKEGSITLTWSYKALNDSELVSGFKLYVANPKDKGAVQEFLVSDANLRSATIDGGFQKKATYTAWAIPVLLNGQEGGKSATTRITFSK